MQSDSDIADPETSGSFAYMKMHLSSIQLRNITRLRIFNSD